jgi:regulator of replication initiation timing
LGDEKKQIEEANNKLKSENEKLKMKLAELEASKKEEDSEEEEDPEERIVYSSSDGLSYEEWEAKALRDLKKTERRDPLPLSCHKRVKRD